MKRFTFLLSTLLAAHVTYAAEAGEQKAATIVKIYSNEVDLVKAGLDSVACRIGRAYYDDEPIPYHESFGEEKSMKKSVTLLQPSNDFTTEHPENNRNSIRVLQISVVTGYDDPNGFTWVNKNIDHVFTPGSTEAIKLTLNLAERDFSFEVVDDK